MTTKKASNPPAQYLVDGCHRVYKERLEDAKKGFKIIKNFDGKAFCEINSFKAKVFAENVAKDYKRSGFRTRIVSLYGEHVLFVRPE